MPNFEELRADIRANVKPNGQEEITGQVMQDVSIAIVDATEQVDTASKARDEQIKGDVQGVRTSVSELSGRVTVIDGKVDALTPEVAKNTQDIADIKAGEAGVADRLDAIEAKDSEQDSRLGILDGEVKRIDGVDRAQDEAIRRIDGTDARQDGEINALCERMDVLEPKVAGLEPRIATNEKDIKVIKARVTNAETDIVAIKGKDDRQDERLATNEEDIRKLYGASNEYNISAINTEEGFLTKEYSLQEAINALDAYLGEQKRNKGVKMTFVEKTSHKPLTYTFRGGLFTSPSTWEQFDYTLKDTISKNVQDIVNIKAKDVEQDAEIDTKLTKNGAIDTTPDGKVYVKGVDGFTGLPTDKMDLEKYLRYMFASIKPENRLPKWFMDSLVCWYNPERQGLRNGVDIKDGVPFILKDFSPNGLDMTMNNFQGAGMSGMDGYGTIDLRQWSRTSGVAVVEDIKRNVVKITNVMDSRYLNLYIYGANIYTPRIKVKITGLAGKHIRFCSENKGEIAADIENDGIYVIDFSKITASPKGFIVNENGVCDITIEQLPFYEGALVFDGTDDYGISKNQPKLDDYTILLKRKIIKHVEFGTGSVATKRPSPNVEGAFWFERDLDTWSFGKNTGITKEKGDISWQTKTSYNGLAIKEGTAPDTDKLVLAGQNASNPTTELVSFALYDFLLFNRSLSEDEISWVKRNVMGEKPQEIPAEAVTTLE